MQWVKDLVLSSQCLGSPALVWVQSLAWELPHAMGVAKRKKKSAWRSETEGKTFERRSHVLEDEGGERTGRSFKKEKALIFVLWVDLEKNHCEALLILLELRYMIWPPMLCLSLPQPGFMILIILRLHPWHREVPGPGTEAELQLKLAPLLQLAPL